jgi:hypothetical protein
MQKDCPNWDWRSIRQRSTIEFDLAPAIQKVRE